MQWKEKEMKKCTSTKKFTFWTDLSGSNPLHYLYCHIVIACRHCFVLLWCFIIVCVCVYVASVFLFAYYMKSLLVIDVYHIFHLLTGNLAANNAHNSWPNNSKRGRSKNSQQKRKKKIMHTNTEHTWHVISVEMWMWRKSTP